VSIAIDGLDHSKIDRIQVLLILGLGWDFQRVIHQGAAQCPGVEAVALVEEPNEAVQATRVNLVYYLESEQCPAEQRYRLPTL